MDTRTQAWLDQFGAYITEVIRRDGWFIQYVGGKTCLRPGCACPPADDPPFAYTVGMFGLNHPELLIHGVSPETAAGVLNDLGGQILGGSTMMPGETIVLERWGRSIVVESVPNPGEIVYTANQYYLRPAEYSVPVLQLTYDDKKGRFPWDEGCDVASQQPRPGTFQA